MKSHAQKKREIIICRKLFVLGYFPKEGIAEIASTLSWNRKVSLTLITKILISQAPIAQFRELPFTIKKNHLFVRIEQMPILA